jgi:hypothetical protein
MKGYLALVVSALLLVGCSPPPYALDEPPESIVLRWNGSLAEQSDGPPDSIAIRWVPSKNSASDVKYVAERHCLSWDMHAEQVREQSNGDTRTTEFICKGPLLR